MNAGELRSCCFGRHYLLASMWHYKLSCWNKFVVKSSDVGRWLLLIYILRGRNFRECPCSKLGFRGINFSEWWGKELSMYKLPQKKTILENIVLVFSRNNYHKLFSLQLSFWYPGLAKLGGGLVGGMVPLFCQAKSIVVLDSNWSIGYWDNAILSDMVNIALVCQVSKTKNTFTKIIFWVEHNVFA